MPLVNSLPNDRLDLEDIINALNNESGLPYCAVNTFKGSFEKTSGHIETLIGIIFSHAENDQCPCSVKAEPLTLFFYPHELVKTLLKLSELDLVQEGIMFLEGLSTTPN